MSRHGRSQSEEHDARETLTASGLPADAPLDALASLEATWGSKPELEAAALSLVGASEDPRAGAAVAALESKNASKAVRRELKRALYRLSQRGLWSPPDAAAPPSARELLGPDEKEPRGWVSAFDRMGARLIWMARPTSGGVASLTAVVDEEAGLRELYAAETTRKMLRNAQRDISAQSGLELVEAPWAHVYRLLRAAADRVKDRTRFAHVPAALKSIAPTPPGAADGHPVDALLDRAAIADDAAALAASAETLTEPELGGWLLPIDWLEAALEEISSSQSSIVMVSPATEQERMRESFTRTTENLFQADGRRDRFADRLEETSFLLAHRGAVDPAKSALAAALALRAGRPIEEIPVLAEIARRSLALAMEARAAQRAEEERSSLVVTPAQAIAEEERRRRGRTR